jgi:predicted RNA polymerase sigma factor
MDFAVAIDGQPGVYDVSSNAVLGNFRPHRAVRTDLLAGIGRTGDTRIAYDAVCRLFHRRPSAFCLSGDDQEMVQAFISLSRHPRPKGRVSL